ncbi:c-type cytochrome [Halomonas lysinitropha]|uniref:Cytochrome c-554(548) n=1 Tax=Halomonas lysinitropha TaxID=2607506 RepID=A0A5K1I1L8_9GAMM|nr:cytochrome c [Halomonas lysinitropha]VVZ93998.1 Cytochrome c-554(548) [Halomonas lysinitropha]
MKSLLVAALLGGAFLALDAQAAGDPEAGKGKISACAACHGTDGMGTAPIYPNLAGQSAAYLESSMKAYREGQRGGGMSALMTPQAQGLSDEDIADIAAYYASLQP